MNRLFLLRCAWLFALIAPACATAMEYSLREWHGEDGLPGEIVSGVTQDEKGYLWIAADVGGFTRFNGIHFDRPGSGLMDDAPASMFMRSVVRHPKLGVLFSSGNGEIWQWDGGAFRKNSLTDQFLKQPVQSWHVQADGTLWAGFFNGKIEFLRDGRVNEFARDEVKGVRQTVTFADDGNGGVWIAAGSTLYHSSQGTVTRTEISWPENELRIASSRQGKPWIVTRNRVGRWDGRAIETVVAIPEQCGAHFVRALLEDRDGNLWVGTRSQGAYLVANGQYQFVPASHRSVAAIFQDEEGNIWLGTSGGGINRLQAKHFSLFDSKSGLLDDLTLSVCEDAQGTIWFANRDGGVARLGKAGIEVMAGKNHWPKTTAMRIAAVLDGGIYLVGGAGQFRSDASDDIKKIDMGDFVPARALLVSRKGDLWLAGESSGLARLDQVGFVLFGKSAGLPDDPVSCFGEDGEGQILVGTTAGGLFRFDGARFESARTAGAKPLGWIRLIHAEKDGTWWVGTGNGLVIFAEGKEYFLSSKQGLPEGAISQMLFDDQGAVWFGSPNGIFRVERQEIMEIVAGRSSYLHTTRFGKNEGFAHISCIDGYQPNSVKGRDGTLWFTTRLGVLAINPNVVRNAGKSPVFIDELRVDDAVQPLSSTTRLPSDLHKMEVRFSVLNFTAPERTPVRYRLEGFDQDWVDAGPERKIVYPRLLPGNYTLRIVSADDGGEWGNAGATLPIIVVPYWWQTVWFQSGLALALAVLLILGVRVWSHRRLRSKLERAERESAVDRERTRIARDIHDELGASLTRISLLSQSAPPEGAAETMRACFNEIYATTTDITRSIDEIVWAVDARHDNLESLVSYFDSYAQGFLSVAKIRYRFDAPGELPVVAVGSSVRHHLFLAFKEALNNCVKHAQATEVTVRIETGEDSLSLIVSDNGNGMVGEPALRLGGGNGLPNLATRMAAIGGGLVVRNAASGGTDVVLMLPLNLFNS